MLMGLISLLGQPLCFYSTINCHRLSSHISISTLIILVLYFLFVPYCQLIGKALLKKISISVHLKVNFSGIISAATAEIQRWRYAESSYDIFPLKGILDFLIRFRHQLTVAPQKVIHAIWCRIINLG